MKLLFEFISDPVTPLTELVKNYPHYIYLILFIMVLLESSLLFFSWIPIQSIIFITGTISYQSNNNLHPVILLILFIIGSQLGNIFKYIRGTKLKTFGKKHFSDSSNFLKNNEIPALILSNFIPVIGILIPLIAGKKKLEFKRYFNLSLIGKILWVSIILFMGFFLGHFKFIVNHYSLIVLLIAIIPISIYELISALKKVGK
jgi:membrane-associated protein